MLRAPGVVCIVVALVATCCCIANPSAAGLFNGKSSNPFSMLNDFLVKATKSSKLTDNLAAIRGAIGSSDFGNKIDGDKSDFISLAKLVSSLGSNDDCSDVRAKQVIEIAQLALKHDGEALRSKHKSRRLNKLMLLCFDASLSNLEQDWLKADINSTMSTEFGHQLSHLDRMNGLYGLEHRFEGSSEEYLWFEVSMRRRKDKKVRPFDDDELYALLGTKKLDDMLSNKANILPDVATLTKAYDRYLGEPCAMLVHDEKVVALLQPVVDYYEIWNTKVTRSFSDKYPTLFKWTSHYLTCDLILKDRQELIEDMKKLKKRREQQQ